MKKAALFNPLYGFRIIVYLSKVLKESGFAGVKAEIRKRMNPPPVVPRPPAEIQLSREEKTLKNLNLAGIGLEIGPSYNPIAPKSQGYRVEILDHAAADALKEKYAKHEVNPDKIEEVDYIWSGEPLSELIGKKDHYDWIIASHLIEHTPDLIGFLRECEKLLKPGGILSLVVPDLRYCFDHFRPRSTTGDILQAHIEKRTKHTPGKIFDHRSSACRLNGMAAWDSGTAGDYSLLRSMELAKELFLQALAATEYIDAHNWCFTPASFRLILQDIKFLGYSGLTECDSFPTLGCEFFIQLKKGGEREIIPRLDLLKEALKEQVI